MIFDLVRHSIFYLSVAIFIKNKYLRLLAVITFASGLLLARGDGIVYGLAIILWLYFKGRIPKLTTYFILGFLNFFTFYYVLDRAIYVSFASVLALGIYESYVFFTKKESIQLLVSPIISYVLGSLIAISIGILYFGYENFIVFLKMSFLEIPKFSPYMFDYVFPFNNIGWNMYWIPFFIFFVVSIKIIDLLRREDFASRKYDNGIFLAIFFLLMSFISIKSVVGRSDVGHIKYVFHYSVICVFLVIQLFINYKKYISASLMLLILGMLFFSPFFDIGKLPNLPQIKLNDIKSTLNILSINDDYWLTNEQERTREYIRNNSESDDYLYVYTNEAAYYYLAERQNPTRFYMDWFANPHKYQVEALEDLKKNEPKLIIYSSANWSNVIDGIPEAKRTPKINEWIMKNYEKATMIESVVILKKREI